jgi:hypothetical protein
MPAYKGSFSNLGMEFDVYSETDADSIIIGVLSNPTDATTFTGVDTVIFPDDNSYYYDIKVRLFNYSGSGEHIAFKHTSTDSYEDMYIDNVELYNIPDNDAGVIAIDQPNTGIGLTNNMPVTIQVKNYGLNTQSNIPVKYSTDNGSTYTTGTIAGPVSYGDTISYTFTTNADLSALGNHEIIITTALSSDQESMNDTMGKVIENYPLPYTQNFDSLSIPSLPAGWSAITGDADQYVETDDYEIVSSPNALHMDNDGADGGQALMAILPGVYSNISNLWMKYDIYSESTSDSVIVGVLTDPTDASTFAGVDTLLFANDYTWYSKASFLTPYTGSGNYIAFKHTSTDSYEDMYVDNLVLETAPTGPVFGASPDSADMGQVRYNSPDTTLQTIIITNEGIGTLSVTSTAISGTNNSNFTIVDTNTYPKALDTLESLEMQVKFHGSSIGMKTASLDVTANSTLHSIPLNGNVIDATIDSFPFVEDMDHMGNPPLGWKTYATANYYWDIGQSTSSSSTGAEQDHTTGTGYFAYTEASSAGTGDSAMIVTVPVDFSSITTGTPKMNFWYHMHGSDMGNIYIDVAVGGTWISEIDSVVGEQQTNQSDPWQLKAVDLGSYANADSIRFTAVSNGSYEGDISIDDVAFGTDLNVDLGPDTAICQGNSLTLDAGANTNWTYEWYVDTMDVVVNTTQMLTVDSAGKYYVKVTGIGGFSGIDSINVSVNQLPTVNLTTKAGPDYCLDAVVDTLTGTPAGGTYSGNGVAANTFNPANAGAGMHTLYYTYTDANGCTNTDSVHVNVRELPVVDAGMDMDVCKGDSVTLTATYNNIFFSEYMEGSSNNKAIEIYNGTGKPVHLDNYAVLTNYNGNPWSGEYTFPAGTVLNHGDVYVIANEQADSAILDKADETLGFSDKGYMMGYNGDDVRALVEYAPNGDTVILDQIGRYDLVDPGSGWDVAGTTNGTSEHTLVRKPAKGPNMGDWDMSAGTDSVSSEWYVMPQDDTTDLGMHTSSLGTKAYAGVSYLWSNGATTKSIKVAPNMTHTYNVSITDAYGCTNSDSVKVNVNPLPNVDLGADSMTLCAADTGYLYAGQFSAYNWSTGATTDSIMVDSAGIGLGAQMITVTVTDSNGCMNMDTVVVSFVDYPAVTITGPDSMKYYTETATLDAGAGFATYSWSTGATTQDITIDSTDVSFGMNTFTVTVTNDQGCSTTASKDVYVIDDTGIEDAEGEMNISLYPNPNSGTFTVEVNGPNADFNLEIININGQLVRSEQINADKFTKRYDLSHMAKGVYYIRLINDEMTQTRKLIIQ